MLRVHSAVNSRVTAYFEGLEQFFVANGISAGTPSGYCRRISSQGDDAISTTTIISTGEFSH